MPEGMHPLLRDYPRETWPDHPNFARSIQHWMGAHLMFRQLCQRVGQDTEMYLDKSRAPDDYADRLGHYGDQLVRNLHGHHHWEDSAFFPELKRADPRFARGLEILEADHSELDAVLDRLTRQSNRVIKLIQLDERQAREEAGGVLAEAAATQNLLSRHLTDEEDLVVPILLHHRMRG